MTSHEAQSRFEDDRHSPQRLRALIELCRVLWTGNRLLITGLIMLTVLMGTATPLVAWLTKLLLDALVAPNVGTGGLAAIISGIALLTALMSVAPVWSGYASEELSRRLAYRIQARITRKLQEFKGLARFENPLFHNRLMMAMQGGESAPTIVLGSGMGLVQQTVGIAGFVVAAVAVSPLIAAVVVAAAVPSLIAEQVYARRRVSLSVHLSATQRRKLFFNQLLSNVQVAKEIRLFNAGDYLRQRTLRELRTINREEHRLAKRTARGRTFLAAGSATASVAALALAVDGALNGSLTAGDVTVAIAAVTGVQSSSRGIMEGLAQTSEAAMRFDHFMSFEQAPPDLPDAESPVKPNGLRHVIELRDVWFRYAPDGPWVLRGATFAIPAGATVALVGANGAGKSTIVKLLTRLYDPEQGQVTWDGVDLRALDLAAYRNRLAAVFQDFGEYDLTAAENVALNDPDMPQQRQKIHRAAVAAGVDGVIQNLPDGYDTMLSRTFAGLQAERTGVELSGGQWQRLALARMYLRDNADVFILDEPTAALDVEAEFELYTHFQAMMAERTNIVISHRMNSARLADYVVVLEGGQVTEHGQPDRLLASNGRYAALMRMQRRVTGATAEAPL